MRVITLAGSPRFPSRSSALLEYAREKLNGQDVEVFHWNLHNFAPEDLIYARFDSPALKTFIEQLQDADGLIVATPVYKAAYSGALKTLLESAPRAGAGRKSGFAAGDWRQCGAFTGRRLRAETGAERVKGSGDPARRVCR